GPLSERLTAEYLEQYALLPLQRAGERMLAATWLDSVDEQALDDLALLFGAPVELVRAREADLRAAIRRAYGTDASTARDLIAGITPEIRLSDDREIPMDDLVTLANEAPVVKLVNFLLLEALESRASDVHLEGYADTLRVRYRLDGVLQEAPSPPS